MSLLLPRAFLTACALVQAAELTRANTWTVSPTPGPGVDFTNIQSAIDAVAFGDVLLVGPGTYPGFVLTKGLSVFGSAGTNISGAITIQGVYGGSRVQLAKLTCTNLQVLDCGRVVLLDEIVVANTTNTLAYIAQVDHCTDVRMQRMTISSSFLNDIDTSAQPSLFVANSHVELLRSSITARRGDLGSSAANDLPGGQGSDALFLGTNADVHVTLSQLRGGKGGDYSAGSIDPFQFYPGNGGDGIRLFGPNARAFVTGQPVDSCSGGNAGIAYLSTPAFQVGAGISGTGLRLSATSSARVSGATFSAGGIGASSTPSGAAIVSAGALTQPVPADPSLEMLPGPQHPGDLVTFVVHAEVGSTVRLRWGRRPIIEDVPGWAEDRLVEQIRSYNLGVVPPSGDVFWTMAMLPEAPLGALIVFQGLSFETNGATEFTQSWPALFR